MDLYPLRDTPHANSRVVDSLGNPIEGLRQSSIVDVETIANNLAEAHLLEMAALHVDPALALQGAITRCVCHTFTDAENNDTPIGLVGSAEHADDPQVGVVFAFMTDRLLQKRRTLYAASREWVEALNVRFPILMAPIWSRNLPAALWLRAIGFEKLKFSRCGDDFFVAYVRTRLE